jgi:hypothetical protein
VALLFPFRVVVNRVRWAHSLLDGFHFYNLPLIALPYIFIMGFRVRNLSVSLVFVLGLRPLALRTLRLSKAHLHLPVFAASRIAPAQKDGPPQVLLSGPSEASLSSRHSVSSLAEAPSVRGICILIGVGGCTLVVEIVKHQIQSFRRLLLHVLRYSHIPLNLELNPMVFVLLVGQSPGLVQGIKVRIVVVWALRGFIVVVGVFFEGFVVHIRARLLRDPVFVLLNQDHVVRLDVRWVEGLLSVVVRHRRASFAPGALAALVIYRNFPYRS